MSAPFSTLVDYWFGALPAEEEAAFEEHLFGCGECTAKLQALVALGAAVRATWRAGAVQAVITRGVLEAMKRERLRLREYRVVPGGSVDCTLTAEDDFVVSRLQAPLAGVQRVDLIGLDWRVEDVPFDPQAGEVLVVPAAAPLRKRPAHTDRFRLVAVEGGADRLLGDYTFVHTPG